MTDLSLASIAFNQPHAIAEQIRLLGKHLQDEHVLTVFDNSDDPEASAEIRRVCVQAGVGCVTLPTTLHHEGLNLAAFTLLAGDAPYIGFLDHDVFPTCPTRLVPLIAEAGFYGVGQRHPATGLRYLWPGFCFFSRAWLGDRELDFSGIRGTDKRDDGDTGSMMWPLFVGERWEDMFRSPHGYQAIREPDDHGLQSWGVEVIGDFLHWSNASEWMAVPSPEERQRLLFELTAAL